jgi:hypothetical protein
LLVDLGYNLAGLLIVHLLRHLLEPLIKLGQLRLLIHLRLVLIVYCILEHSILLRKITWRHLLLRHIIINLCWLLLLISPSVKGVLELLVLHHMSLVWKVLLGRGLCGWGRGSVEGLATESKLLTSSDNLLIYFPFVVHENLNIGCLLRGLCLDLLIIVSVDSSGDLLVDHILNYFRIDLASKDSRQDLLCLRKILLYLGINRWNWNLPK